MAAEFIDAFRCTGPGFTTRVQLFRVFFLLLFFFSCLPFPVYAVYADRNFKLLSRVEITFLSTIVLLILRDFKGNRLIIYFVR